MRLELSKEVWERKCITDSRYGFKVDRPLNMCLWGTELSHVVHQSIMGRSLLQLEFLLPMAGSPSVFLVAEFHQQHLRVLLTLMGPFRAWTQTVAPSRHSLYSEVGVPFIWFHLTANFCVAACKHETTVASLDGKLNLFHAILDLSF